MCEALYCAAASRQSFCQVKVLAVYVFVCLWHTRSGGPAPCMEEKMSEYGDLRSLQVQKVTAQAQRT